MNNFECCICKEKLNNPVECSKCNNNICESHIPKLNNKCPLCQATPFNYKINAWLRRTVLALDYYKCKCCGIEGDADSFWSHLIENHKKEIMEEFTVKKEPEKKTSCGGYNNNGINNPKPKEPEGTPEGPILNPLAEQVQQIEYCHQINNSFNCNCCPDHICREGNCMCVSCMRKNIIKFNFTHRELINKQGKVAKFNKGRYYCGCNYEQIVVNIIGKKFIKKNKCSYPSTPCNNCKFLANLQNIYYGR